MDQTHERLLLFRCSSGLDDQKPERGTRPDVYRDWRGPRGLLFVDATMRAPGSITRTRHGGFYLSRASTISVMLGKGRRNEDSVCDGCGLARGRGGEECSTALRTSSPVGSPSSPPSTGTLVGSGPVDHYVTCQRGDPRNVGLSFACHKVCASAHTSIALRRGRQRGPQDVR